MNKLKGNNNPDNVENIPVKGGKIYKNQRS